MSSQPQSNSKIGEDVQNKNNDEVIEEYASLAELTDVLPNKQQEDLVGTHLVPS